MIRIERSQKSYRYQRDGAVFDGRRGLLKINGKTWHTTELLAKNGQPYVSLLPGKYVVEMARMATGRRALRFLADGHTIESYASRPATFKSLSEGRIYAHAVAAVILRPDHLKGCVGVGMEVAQDGVRASARAMDEIYAELGGFVEGERFELEIVS